MLFERTFVAVLALLWPLHDVAAFAPQVQHSPSPQVSLAQVLRRRHVPPGPTPPQITTMGMLPIAESISSSSQVLTSEAFNGLLTMGTEQAEALGGPLFGASLFPYLAFLYFLSRKETDCPKGVTVGFTVLLLFVFLTIPAAITAKLQYGATLADSDWLHGSAESLLTITNLITVVAFRQALNAKERQLPEMPASVTSYGPMIALTVPLILLAGVTALVPALTGAEVHTPYLNGFMDLPSQFFANNLGANLEPDNALTVACWIIHVSSLVEFLVVMGYAWRWADVVDNPTWKGLTWGLIPLHSSGICACTYHLFYNRIPLLVALQAFLTCVGNTTAAYAAYRIARSSGWKPQNDMEVPPPEWLDSIFADDNTQQRTTVSAERRQESDSLVGFEDLGNALAGDTDYSFVAKLFLGCAVASYAIKYGETFVDFPYDANAFLGLTVILVPSALNAFKWYKRGLDPKFEGWF